MSLLNFSMLLDNQIWERLKLPNVMTGIILLVIGLFFAIFAKKITKLVRRNKKIDPADRLYLVLKAFALVVILAALIIMVIR